jgi:hypothetical protein
MAKENKSKIIAAKKTGVISRSREDKSTRRL